MSDCGICLEPLKKPVSIPCGHIHCEKCLRSHIINGKDALASTCPTCRQAFHIATPDLAVVPEKYHKFIQPSIRQVYIDVPSISKLTKEVGSLKTQIKELKRKTKDLDTLCETYEHQLAICDQKERDWKLKVENLLFDNGELRQECESLKFKYLDGTNTASASRSGMDVERTSETELIDLPVPLRPKRALPKSRSSRLRVRHSDAQNVDPPPQFVKRVRITRQSDASVSGQRSHDDRSTA